MELASFLNQQQIAAVEHREGPLLVIAGAGSGKTRVIQYRVLNLILNGVPPERILLLTFTRRAAKEMLARAAKQDPRCGLVEGGTFHAFGAKVMRRYAAVLGVSENFTVLDAGDAEEAIHKVASNLGFYALPKRFPQKASLQKILSAAKNKALPLARILEFDYPNFVDCAPELERLQGEYAKYKLELGYFDYDDLLLYLKLLLSQEPIRQALTEEYHFLMVDEYQDTNQLQGEIVELLGRGRGNVMVVGDDAQSIYGFRGAHHENILNFPQLFPGATCIKLEANYRSTQEILNLGNQVLDAMPHKFQKRLTSAEDLHGEAPSLKVFKEPSDESNWIADQIQELYHEGEPLREIAVLFRSSHLSFQLQTEMAKRRIPFEVHGGKKFSDMAHVKDLLSYLKLLANPRDELAWNRVLMLFPGIGPKTAGQLTQQALASPGFRGVHEVFLKQPEKKAYKSDLLFLSSALVQASEQAQSIADQFLTLQKAYTPLLEQRYDNWVQRAKDLDSLGQIAGRYQSLTQLLLDFALEPPERGVVEVRGIHKEEDGHVVLSTIHSSKGLEWGSLFLLGMIEGIFPTAYALRNDEGLEEEQRLFYVALTRAKQRLFLTYCHYGFSGGITQFNKPSRFLGMIGLHPQTEPGQAAGQGAMAKPNKPPIAEPAKALSKEEILAQLQLMMRR